jgi:hypothetical protein
MDRSQLLKVCKVYQSCSGVFGLLVTRSRITDVWFDSFFIRDAGETSAWLRNQMRIVTVNSACVVITFNSCIHFHFPRVSHYSFLGSAFAAALMDYSHHTTDTSKCDAESDGPVSAMPKDLTAPKIVTDYSRINSKSLQFQAQGTLASLGWCHNSG